MDLQAFNQQWDQIRVGLGRCRPWFDLCRLPNSLAVAADPLAGALLVGAGWGQMPYAICLMLGALFLHAGAVVLNDWHDLKADRVENPDRPMAAGLVGRWQGLFGAIVLLSVGWTFASVPGFQIGQIGLAVLGAMLLHEFIMKGAPVGKAMPAVARTLALLMGMMLVPVADSAAGWSVGWPLRVFCMCILGVCALGAAILAQRPPDALRRAIAGSGAIVVGLAVLTLSLMRLFFPGQALYPSAAIWVGLLLVVAGYPIARAILRPSDNALRAAAWGALLGTVLVDAAAVAFTRGVMVSLPVAAMVPLVVYTRRRLETARVGGDDVSATTPAGANELPVALERPPEIMEEPIIDEPRP